MTDRRRTDLPIPSADDFGGDTKAHYVSNEPRLPAEVAAARDREELLAHVDRAPTAPSAPPPLSIAEMFQDTLWRAYRAGALSGEPTREGFARWYELEVIG